MKEFSIKDIFSIDDLQAFKKFDENKMRGPCPTCNSSSSNDSFILFLDTNTSYCHKTTNKFNLYETFALKLGLINCSEGRNSNEEVSPIKDIFGELVSSIETEYGFGIHQLKYINKQHYVINEITLPKAGILISDFVRKVAVELKHQQLLFLRPDSKEIVEIGRIKIHKTNEFVYNGFINIRPSRFITLAERFFCPGVYAKVEKDGIKAWEFLPKSMSKELSNTVIKSQILEQALPQISRIFNIPIPILDKKKLTFPKLGFDEKFSSWLPFNAPEIIEGLSLKAAKSIIQKIMQEFCFKSKQDFTNAVAALLTPFLRGLFTSFCTRTPIFFYKANRERAGKDYLAGITGIVYEGFSLEEPPISNSENARSNNTEELRKKILSAMINGRKRLHFSNNKGHIDNAVFEAVTTADKWTDRVLGHSKTLTFDNELDFSLSGNVGVSFTPDFANRARFIRLSLDIEDANSRKFENTDLHGWVKKNRSLVISALYSLVKNWIDKGSKPGSIPFTSYPQWAAICGGIMESADYDNPCTPDKETLALAGDTATSEIKELFELCYEKKPEEWLQKSEIKDIVNQNENSSFSDMDFQNKSDNTKFGIMISKYIGRIFSDIRLTVQDTSVRSSRQKLKFTKESKESVDIFGNGNLSNIGNLQTQEIQINNIFIDNKGHNGTKVTDVTKKNPEIKLDREIQFFEAPESADILKQKATITDVKKCIKKNVKGTAAADIHKICGNGTDKILHDLIKNKKITKKNNLFYMVEVKK